MPIVEGIVNPYYPLHSLRFDVGTYFFIENTMLNNHICNNNRHYNKIIDVYAMTKAFKW